MTRWRQTVVDIECQNGLRSLPAWTTTEAVGLSVHEYNGWTVTHDASGKAAIKELPSKKAAQEAALALSAEADWCVSLAEMLTAKKRYRQLVVKVATEWGGRPATKAVKGQKR